VLCSLEGVFHRGVPTRRWPGHVAGVAIAAANFGAVVVHVRMLRDIVWSLVPGAWPSTRSLVTALGLGLALGLSTHRHMNDLALASALANSALVVVAAACGVLALWPGSFGPSSVTAGEGEGVGVGHAGAAPLDGALNDAGVWWATLRGALSTFLYCYSSAEFVLPHMLPPSAGDAPVGLAGPGATSPRPEATVIAYARTISLRGNLGAAVVYVGVGAAGAAAFGAGVKPDVLENFSGGGVGGSVAAVVLAVNLLSIVLSVPMFLITCWNSAWALACAWVPGLGPAHGGGRAIVGTLGGGCAVACGVV
jgi:hypothetical protein